MGSCLHTQTHTHTAQFFTVHFSYEGRKPFHKYDIFIYLFFNVAVKGYYSTAVCTTLLNASLCVQSSQFYPEFPKKKKKTDEKRYGRVQGFGVGGGGVLGRAEGLDRPAFKLQST